MSELTKKPDFFIVGAPKCGTTSFYHYLRQHPQIFMPENKEPHYFGSDLKKRSDEFIKTEEEYLSLFKDADPSQITGEASTYYLYSKAAREEIKSYNPHAKIIIMLRNPIDFLHSLHAQLLFSGNEDVIDFSEALALEKERTLGYKLPPFIDLEDKLFYREQVRRMPSQVGSYIQTFGNKNVLIILMEDLQNKPGVVYKQALKLLNVDSQFEPEFIVKNPSKKVHIFWLRNLVKKYHFRLGQLRGVFSDKPVGIIKFIIQKNSVAEPREGIPLDLKVQLQKEFVPTIEKLESIINRNLLHWKGTSA